MNHAPTQNWAAHRRRQAMQPTRLTEMVARLIHKAAAETGQAPTNEALARTLAISLQRVRHHRRLLGA